MRGISETAKGAKGLVSRFVLISTTNPDLWTTVTVWQTKEDYRNYWDGPPRPKRPAPPPHAASASASAGVSAPRTGTVATIRRIGEEVSTWRYR